MQINFYLFRYLESAEINEETFIRTVTCSSPEFKLLMPLNLLDASETFNDQKPFLMLDCKQMLSDKKRHDMNKDRINYDDLSLQIAIVLISLLFINQINSFPN